MLPCNSLRVLMMTDDPLRHVRETEQRWHSAGDDARACWPWIILGLAMLTTAMCALCKWGGAG